MEQLYNICVWIFFKIFFKMMVCPVFTVAGVFRSFSDLVTLFIAYFAGEVQIDSSKISVINVVIKNLIGEELVASAIKSAMVELTPGEVTARTKIEPLVQQKLSESLTQKYGEGVVFVNKVVINDMDFEEAYNAAIQQKSIAQQNADRQKIENAAAIAKAEADKQVAITNAEAEAQKTAIKAEAQAEANKKIAESLSDTLIEYQKIQKWDGKLSTVTGSSALVGIDAVE